MRNDNPPAASPELRRAVAKSVRVKRQQGFTDEQLLGGELPLLACSVTVRAGLDPQTPEEIRDTYQQVGEAIGAYLVSKPLETQE